MTSIILYFTPLRLEFSINVRTRFYLFLIESLKIKCHVSSFKIDELPYKLSSSLGVVLCLSYESTLLAKFQNFIQLQYFTLRDDETQSGHFLSGIKCLFVTSIFSSTGFSSPNVKYNTETETTISIKLSVHPQPTAAILNQLSFKNCFCELKIQSANNILCYIY